MRLSGRIIELHKKSVELKNEKQSLDNQSESLRFDSEIIEEIAAGLSDDDAIGNVSFLEKVVSSEMKQTSEAIDDNSGKRQDKVQEVDSYITALEDNLSKLEQMKNVSDLGKNDESVEQTEKRIGDLYEIKALLDGESDNTPSHSEISEVVKSINQILDKPGIDVIDELMQTSALEAGHKGAGSEQVKAILMKEKFSSDERKVIRSAIMYGIIGEKEIRGIGSKIREKYDSLITERNREYDKLQSKQQDIARRLAMNPSAQDRERINDEILNLRKQEEQYQNKYSRQDIVRDILQEYRQIGPSEDDLGQKYESGWLKSSLKVMDAIESIRPYLPTDWIEKSNDVSITTRHVKRGYFNMNNGKPTIALSASGSGMRRCAFHEMGHFYEELFPEIRKLEHEFYNRRTSGEDLQWLGHGYDKSEVARFDSFIDPYMGKDYGNTENSGYELLSMGLESAFMGSYNMARDTEYQDFIFGILASI